jgi:hypothetical protein
MTDNITLFPKDSTKEISNTELSECYAHIDRVVQGLLEVNYAPEDVLESLINVLLMGEYFCSHCVNQRIDRYRAIEAELNNALAEKENPLN